MLAAISPDDAIDITSDICPMTFVRVRLALDRLQPGQVLSVRLRGEEPSRNVPASAELQGHAVVGCASENDGVEVVMLRKGKPKSRP